MRASTPNNTSTTIPIITIFCQEQPTGPSDTFSETSVFQIYEILFLSAHDVNQIRSVVRKTSQSINANNSVTDVMLLGRHECHHQTDTGTGKRGNKANNEQAEKNKSSKCVCVCVGLGFTDWEGLRSSSGGQKITVGGGFMSSGRFPKSMFYVNRNLSVSFLTQTTCSSWLSNSLLQFQSDPKDPGTRHK